MRARIPAEYFSQVPDSRGVLYFAKVQYVSYRIPAEYFSQVLVLRSQMGTVLRSGTGEYFSEVQTLR
jgi:hypothetical protein